MYNRPRLILIIPSLSPGGAERVISLLLPYFCGYFHTKLVLIEDLRFFNIPKEVEVISLNKLLGSKLNHIKSLPLSILRLTEIFNDFRPDISLSFMEEANLLNLIVSGIYRKNKIIISQRTNPILQHRGLLGCLIKVLSRYIYRKANKIIVVSKGLKRILIENYKISEEKIVVIYNPVRINPSQYWINKTQEDSNYLINVGRLVRAKDHKTLLNAFKIIMGYADNLYLFIVGDGKERENLVKYSQKLGIMDRVKFTGFVSEPERLVKDARVFVLSSVYEGLPNALLEAMAVGCPVVATDCATGPREILGENEYGLLAPVGDFRGIAHQVITLLKDKDLWSYMREKALERAKDFHISKISQEYLSVLMA